MKALILKEYGSFSYEDVPTPAFGENEVLVRVKACAICGSDVHGMDGSTGRRRPPIIMGHEVSGVIEKVGSNVGGFKAGDRITFDSTVYCGECYFCRRGEINLCDNRRVLGVSCDEYSYNGAFAEYVAVPRHILYPLPDKVSFEHAAMIEPLSVALHAVRRTSVPLNCTAVVVGTGVIGLFIIQLLRASGCGSIIAVDTVQDRLDMALKLGATTGLITGGTDPVREILAETNGRGADISFDAVGISESLKTAVSCLKKGGSMTLVGNLKANVDLPLQMVVTRQISLFGSCASAGEYTDCLELIARGAVDAGCLISAAAPLSEGDEWFKRLYRREPGLMKVILLP